MTPQNQIAAENQALLLQPFFHLPIDKFQEAVFENYLACGRTPSNEELEAAIATYTAHHEKLNAEKRAEILDKITAANPSHLFVPAAEMEQLIQNGLDLDEATFQMVLQVRFEPRGMQPALARAPSANKPGQAETKAKQDSPKGNGNGPATAPEKPKTPEVKVAHDVASKPVLSKITDPILRAQMQYAPIIPNAGNGNGVQQPALAVNGAPKVNADDEAASLRLAQQLQDEEHAAEQPGADPSLELAQRLQAIDVAAKADAEERERKNKAAEAANLLFLEGEKRTQQTQFELDAKMAREQQAKEEKQTGEERDKKRMQEEQDHALARAEQEGQTARPMRIVDSNIIGPRFLKMAQARKAVEYPNTIREILASAALNCPQGTDAHAYTKTDIRRDIPRLYEIDNFFPLSGEMVEIPQADPKAPKVVKPKIIQTPDEILKELLEYRAQIGTVTFRQPDGKVITEELSIAHITRSIAEVNKSPNANDTETLQNIREYISRVWNLAKRIDQRLGHIDYTGLVCLQYHLNIADAGHCIPGLFARLHPVYAKMVALELNVEPLPKPAENPKAEQPKSPAKK